MSLSTSGAHGINGDLFVNGLIQGSSISSSNIIVGGNDITTALVNVGSFETTLSNITNGTTSVPKSTLSQNSNYAYNMNIQSNLDNDASNATNWYFGLLSGNSGQVNAASSSVLNYTKSTNQTNLLSSVEINANTSQTTHIKGALTCDTSCNVLGKLTTTGGITIPSGQTLNGISTTTLGYVDATSSIQTQLNNKVALTGSQTISGLKTFSGGVVVSDPGNSPYSLTVSGDVIAYNSCTFGNISNPVQNHNIYGTLAVNQQATFYQKPWFFTGSSIYVKGGYGGVITISGATTISDGLINEFYHLKTTVTTTPILTIPNPSANLVGCELKFFRTQTANAVGLQCATNTNGFIIGSSVITPTFTLGSTGGTSMWYKLFLVCLPNPDVSGSYVWYQTFYM